MRDSRFHSASSCYLQKSHAYHIKPRYCLFLFVESLKGFLLSSFSIPLSSCALLNSIFSWIILVTIHSLFTFIFRIYYLKNPCLDYSCASSSAIALYFGSIPYIIGHFHGFSLIYFVTSWAFFFWHPLLKRLNA